MKFTLFTSLAVSASAFDVSLPAMREEIIEKVNSKAITWKAHVSPRYVFVDPHLDPSQTDLWVVPALAP